MEWVALGVLALLLSGSPQAGDFGPPVLAQVELVSLRVEPTPAWQGKEVTGYLYLAPVVQDSPDRPVETLATPRFAYLPGSGLNPRPFRVVADGRWHVPEIAWGSEWQRTFGGFWEKGAPGAVVSGLYLYPLSRGRSGYATGTVGLRVALYVFGLGWASDQPEVWTSLDGSARTVAFSSGVGRVMAHLAFRRAGP